MRRFDPFFDDHLAWHFVSVGSAHDVPVAAAASFARLGLPDLAIGILRRAKPDIYDAARRRAMAFDAAGLADWFGRSGERERAAQVYEIALGWYEDPAIRQARDRFLAR